jgi:hypothetical protein
MVLDHQFGKEFDKEHSVFQVGSKMFDQFELEGLQYQNLNQGKDLKNSMGEQSLSFRFSG